MKASFELNVKCPDNWVVVSNENAKLMEIIESKKFYYFYPTPPISTYLFCINAGNWFELEIPLETNYKGI